MGLAGSMSNFPIRQIYTLFLYFLSNGFKAVKFEFS